MSTRHLRLNEMLGLIKHWQPLEFFFRALLFVSGGVGLNVPHGVAVIDSLATRWTLVEL